MGPAKREIMALRVAAEGIRNMSDTDACKLAEMLDVKLWYPDLHHSKDERYPLPQVVVKRSNSQTDDIAERYLIPSGKWVKRRVLVRAVLERMMQYLKPLQQTKAGIALRMLNVADAQLDGWKEELSDLAERFKGR